MRWVLSVSSMQLYYVSPAACKRMPMQSTLAYRRTLHMAYLAVRFQALNESRKSYFRSIRVPNTLIHAIDKHNFQGIVVALHHALSGELIDIRPFESNLKSETTKALYKSRHLEVFRMILLAGKAMPAHQVAGETTVQCIEGCIELTAAGTSQVMRSGDLICLAGGAIHALRAVEDSSVLVTILLHGG